MLGSRLVGISVFLIPAFAKPFHVSCHPKPAIVHNSTDEQMTKQTNALAKSKELQPNAQSQRFAAHLLLPQPHHRQLTLTFTENRISITKALTNFEV